MPKGSPKVVIFDQKCDLGRSKVDFKPPGSHFGIILEQKRTRIQQKSILIRLGPAECAERSAAPCLARARRAGLTLQFFRFLHGSFLLPRALAKILALI